MVLKRKSPIHFSPFRGKYESEFLAVSCVGEGREEGTLLLKRGSVSFIVMRSKIEDYL